MKLFSYLENENQFNVGIKIEDGIFNLSQAFDIYQKAKGAKQKVSIQFLQMLVEMGYCSKQIIDNILNEPWVHSKLENLRLDPDEVHCDLPIARPTKIIGIGRNYIDHAKELKHDIPTEPLFFCKAPSTLIPHGEDIVIPEWYNDRVDHEAELGIIIGKIGRYCTEEEAMDIIAGYTIINDVTARAMQKEDLANGKPWYRSKSMDTFCPSGPYLVPADAIENPQKLDILLKVNGETRQKANTSSMIFKIPELIVYLSRYMTLLPGDIIATGTPKGVSPIQEGDEIEITITGLGVLKNKVVKEVF